MPSHREIQWCEFPTYLMRDNKVRRNTFSVGWRMQILAGPYGYCDASDEELAEMLNISVRSVKRARTKLVELKYFEKVRNDGVRSTDDCYRPLLDQVDTEETTVLWIEEGCLTYRAELDLEYHRYCVEELRKSRLGRI